MRILKEPEFNLLMQQSNLMKREGINIRFTDEVGFSLVVVYRRNCTGCLRHQHEHRKYWGTQTAQSR